MGGEQWLIHSPAPMGERPVVNSVPPAPMGERPVVNSVLSPPAPMGERPVVNSPLHAPMGERPVVNSLLLLPWVRDQWLIVSLPALGGMCTTLIISPSLWQKQCRKGYNPTTESTSAQG